MARTKFGFQSLVTKVTPKTDYNGASLEVTFQIKPPAEPRESYHQRSFDDLQKALDQNPRPEKKRGQDPETYDRIVKTWEEQVTATRTAMEKIQQDREHFEQAKREFKKKQQAYMFLCGAVMMLMGKPVDMEMSPVREADIPTGDVRELAATDAKALPAGKQKQEAVA